MSVTKWMPFDAMNSSLNIKYALILLNQPIYESTSGYFSRLWSNATIRICADGATNRLYEWSKTRNQFDFIPDYIIGDLDSSHNQISDFYLNNGSKVFKINCQNSTDFTKCLRFASDCLKKESNFNFFPDLRNSIKEKIDFETIYCFCGFAGRFDHALSNINSLYQSCIHGISTYIISDESVTFLLQKGKNLIFFKDSSYCGKYCGYFPIGKSSVISTKGLKWDVTREISAFGGLVSSSNEFDTNENYVEIDTENELLWTMSIKLFI